MASDVLTREAALPIPSPPGRPAPDAVAVLICARDAAATVGRAVRSALAQPEAAEVVVVDDASTDATAAVARGCEDGTGRLRVLRLAVNQGPAAARNRAIAASASPLLCVLDADDFLLPGRLRRLLDTAGADWDLAADDLLVAHDPDARGPFPPIGLAEAGPPRTLDLEAFVRGNIPDPASPRRELGYLKPLMRRAFLERHGLGYDPDLRLGEDYALYAAALAHGARLRLVAPCGYVAVVRPGSLSHAHRTEDLRRLAEADTRLLALPGLAPAAARALRDHRRSVRHKFHHRAALDHKRAGRYFSAAGHVLRDPATALHILRETVRAKWPRPAPPSPGS